MYYSIFFFIYLYIHLFCFFPLFLPVLLLFNSFTFPFSSTQHTHIYFYLSSFRCLFFSLSSTLTHLLFFFFSSLNSVFPFFFLISFFKFLRPLLPDFLLAVLPSCSHHYTSSSSTLCLSCLVVPLHGTVFSNLRMPASIFFFSLKFLPYPLSFLFHFCFSLIISSPHFHFFPYSYLRFPSLPFPSLPFPF